MNRWLALTFGSVAGGFARYAVGGTAHGWLGPRFPSGTLVVNLTGCFLIGLFDRLIDTKHLAGPETRMLLIAGFCGAYTTFSTFIFETSNLLKDGQWARAAVNVLVSVALGLALFQAGETVGKSF